MSIDWDNIPEWFMRDVFAAAALAGMCADHETEGEPHEFAEAAYNFADAMLTARSKDNDDTDADADEEPSTGGEGDVNRGLGYGEDILPPDTD